MRMDVLGDEERPESGPGALCLIHRHRPSW
jgi:hypothetical protein